MAHAVSRTGGGVMDKERRISYIDAMRGFTMILVVYSHICHFCLGDSLIGYNRIFFLFRLPCFFFISGWLFEPVGRRPFKAVVRQEVLHAVQDQVYLRQYGCICHSLARLCHDSKGRVGQSSVVREVVLALLSFLHDGLLLLQARSVLAVEVCTSVSVSLSPCFLLFPE